MMIQTLNALGFTLTDQDEANIQYTRGLIDVFFQSDGKVILAYASNEVIEIKDSTHLEKMIEALSY